MSLAKLAMLSVIVISAMGLLACEVQTIADSTCESVAEDNDLIKLLEKNGPAEVMRINQIELISHDVDGIYCEGTVKFDNTEKWDIKFHWFIDEDGDSFIGFSKK